MLAVSHLYSPEGKYCEYSMGQKNGLHAFGYNSDESEPISMKFRTLRAEYWGLALADFGHDPRSSDSLRRSRIFCEVNNARFHRFPVEKKLRHLNTTPSIDVAM